MMGQINIYSVRLQWQFAFNRNIIHGKLLNMPNVMLIKEPLHHNANDDDDDDDDDECEFICPR